MPYFLQRRTLSGFPGCLPGCTQAAMYSERGTFSLWFSRAESTSLPERFCLISSSLEWQASHRNGTSDYADAVAAIPCLNVKVFEAHVSMSWKRRARLRAGRAGEVPIVSLCLLGPLSPLLTMLQTQWLLCVPTGAISCSSSSISSPWLCWSSPTCVAPCAGSSRKTHWSPDPQ